jgi:hypothetical protein
MLSKYLEIVTDVKTNTFKNIIRDILHWISLPIKLLLIGCLGVYGIIYNRLKYKKRPPVARRLNKTQKTQRMQKILKFLPVLKNEFYELYLPRNKLIDVLNGANHSPDHQLLRHGQYVFLMSKLGKRNAQMDYALTQCMQGNYLARGYKWDYTENKFIFNMKSTSGDMLLGLSLAMLDTNLQNSSQELLLEKYDQLVSNIIEFDYSILEAQEPPDEPYKTLWNKRLKEASLRPEAVRMKSSRAMFQPGLETVGAQALTILAALKTNAKKNKSKSSEKEYWNLFYKKGYSLLSLLPTAYLPDRRGYFNDANCVHALYILLKLADTKVEKFVYRFALRYIFNLSKSWYNLYFVGLIKEVAPDMITAKYLEEAKEYMYEEDPLTWTYDNSIGLKTNTTPIPLGLLKHSEFAYGDKLDQYNQLNTGDRVFSGLSELAVMVLLEDEIYENITNPKSFN